MSRPELNALLSTKKEKLVAYLLNRLPVPRASRYREFAPEVLERHVRQLVHSLLESVAANPSDWTAGVPLVRHAAQIAAQRIGQGFGLRELQRALSMLEEKTWQLIVAHRPPTEQVRDLGLITHLIGSAKDHLALVYLEQRARAVSAAQRLKTQIPRRAGGPASASASGAGPPVRRSPRPMSDI